MTAINKLTSFLTWAAFALAAAAAPSHLAGLSKEFVGHSNPLPAGHGGTIDAPTATCTYGIPASKQHASGYPIDDYTVVTPAEGWASYMVRPDWYAEHLISGPHYMAFSHQSDPYGPFKCQYTCNAAENCSAFFVWYERVGTPEEHLNCALFDAVVTPSVFVETNGAIAAGAYDRLCDGPSIRETVRTI